MTPTRSWTALVLLTFCYALNQVDRQLVSILAEPIRLEIGLSDTQLGLLTGAMFAIFYTVFALPAAWLADRSNRVRVISASCAVFSLFTAIFGLVQSFWQMALVRAGVAIGEAGGVAPSFSVISDLFPPQRRGVAVAIFMLGLPLGTAFGAAGGAWISLNFGWRMAFPIMGGIGIAMALLMWLVIEEPVRGRLDAASATADAVPMLQTASLFVKQPKLRFIILGSCCSSIVQYALIAWTPAFLMRVQGMTLAEIGLYFAPIMAITVAMGTFLCGFLVDRVMVRHPGAFGLIPAAGVLVAMPFYFIGLLADDWRIGLSMLSLAQMFTIFQPAAISAVQSSLPASQRSAGAAIFMLVNGLVSMSAGPLLVGAISDGAGATFGDSSLRVALLALAPIFLLASLLHYRSALAGLEATGREGLQPEEDKSAGRSMRL